MEEAEKPEAGVAKVVADKNLVYKQLTNGLNTAAINMVHSAQIDHEEI